VSEQDPQAASADLQQVQSTLNQPYHHAYSLPDVVHQLKGLQRLSYVLVAITAPFRADG
jgi:hypothetical protein